MLKLTENPSVFVLQGILTGWSNIFHFSGFNPKKKEEDAHINLQGMSILLSKFKLCIKEICDVILNVFFQPGCFANIHDRMNKSVF